MMFNSPNNIIKSPKVSKKIGRFNNIRNSYDDFNLQGWDSNDNLVDYSPIDDDGFTDNICPFGVGFS